MIRQSGWVDRFFQTLLITSTAGVSWLMMMLLHECGHVFSGWISGAQLLHVDFPPWGFSRTDFGDNPHPLFVAWSGAIAGCLLPLIILFFVRVALPRYGYLARWLAGLCLVANGAYLIGGILHEGRLDDGGVILQNGGAAWQLVLFGIPAVALGLYLWNGLGPEFGIGPSPRNVDRRAAVSMTVALLVIASVETWISLL